jgi:hypothetical protein
MSVPRHIWTEAEVAMLRARYPHQRTADIAAALGVSKAKVYYKADALGLRKSTAFLASQMSGRTDGTRGEKTRFASGKRPWNAGKKIGTHGRSAETQFKPGQLTGKARMLLKQIGSERISKDGYLERKINDDQPIYKRWRAVHRIVWERANGPIPRGHAIVFRPGCRSINAAAITVDKLELVTRRELMRRNSIHNYPEPIVQVMQARGALVRAINRRSKAA